MASSGCIHRSRSDNQRAEKTHLHLQVGLRATVVLIGSRLTGYEGVGHRVTRAGFIGQGAGNPAAWGDNLTGEHD